jgi:hypothetical protein
LYNSLPGAGLSRVNARGVRSSGFDRSPRGPGVPTLLTVAGHRAQMVTDITPRTCAPSRNDGEIPFMLSEEP